MGLHPDLGYCADNLRRLDRDRWLMALMAPPGARQTIIGLYALNLELALIRDMAREPILMEVRLAWWQEEIAGVLKGSEGRQPASRLLGVTLRNRETLGPLLQALIEARNVDLAPEPPATFADLIGYAEATAGTLQVLVARVLGFDAAEVAELARDAGMAYGLAGLARAAPWHAARQHCYLPADLLASEGLTRDMLCQKRPLPAISRVIGHLAREAEARLAVVRSGQRAVPAGTRAALLPAALAAVDLQSLRRARYDPWLAASKAHPMRRLLAILVARATGRV